jgi:hypothetical protein
MQYRIELLFLRKAQRKYTIDSSTAVIAAAQARYLYRQTVNVSAPMPVGAVVTNYKREKTYIRFKRKGVVKVEELDLQGVY